MLGELNRAWEEDEPQIEGLEYEADCKFERDRENGWHWAARMREDLIFGDDEE